MTILNNPELPKLTKKVAKLGCSGEQNGGSELIAIEKGLNYVDTLDEPDFKSIWILTNSRSSIHHLSNWKEVSDRVEIPILKLSANFEFHIQEFLSLVGLLLT
ncbi:hypothetical protein TNCV_2338981 [Trichonephila clavipes]|nr:hypothetical protein TNCV_2338981 [Trichonephila clavipes]